VLLVPLLVVAMSFMAIVALLLAVVVSCVCCVPASAIEPTTLPSPTVDTTDNGYDLVLLPPFLSPPERVSDPASRYTGLDEDAPWPVQDDRAGEAEGGDFVLELVVLEDRRSTFSVSFLRLRRLIHTTVAHLDGSPCGEVGWADDDDDDDNDDDDQQQLQQQDQLQSADAPPAAEQDVADDPVGNNVMQMQKGGVRSVSTENNVGLHKSWPPLTLPLASLGVLVLLGVTVCVLRCERRRRSNEVLLRPPTMEELGLPFSASPLAADGAAPVQFQPQSAACVSIEVPVISSAPSSYCPLEEPLLSGQ